jgi:hypothetical protein
LGDLDRLFDGHLQEAFGERHEEFTVRLRDRLRALWLMALKTRTGDDLTAADEDAFLTGVRGRKYPAVKEGMVPKMGPPLERDRRRPFCNGCGGTGMGDYPFPCNTCGGTGNR